MKLQRNIKHEMNLALDHMLTDEQEKVFEIRVTASPSDSLRWDRMQMVDSLFRNEPMLDAPIDFASKLMASIAAIESGAELAKPPVKKRAGLDPALSLLLVAVVLSPLAALGVLTVQYWRSDPAALNDLLQRFVLLLNSVTQSMAGFLQVILSTVADKPILPALLTTIIPLLMVWAWFMWYAAQRSQQVVYRIPVMVA